MGQTWKYVLRLLAVVAAAAPAIMNVFGCLESFTDPIIRYAAVVVGMCADVYLLASLPALAHFRLRKRKWALRTGLAIWLACALWTGLSGASWLKHKFDADQAPVEQQKETQARAEGDRRNDLAGERETLREEEEISRTGKTREIRDNAKTLAAETRKRIAELEKPNTTPAKTENAPIKSPFAGYELFVTFGLLAFSQGCWFMALDEETAEASRAEIGKREAEGGAGNGAPVPGNKRRKQGGNGKRKLSGAPDNAEGAQIIEFRKRPTREEIIAFLDGNSAAGKNKWEGAKARFGYTDRQLRNILNEKAAA